jgi:hypothetical protein
MGNKMPVATQILYCNVCRSDILPGEDYEPFPSNKYSCHHSRCTPKKISKPKIDKLPSKKLNDGPKKRRGRDCSPNGGDGYVEVH